jgi:hypothetical protein
MDEDVALVKIAALEAAINRCTATEGRKAVVLIEDGSEVADRSQVALSKDASLMAEVYALMIFGHRDIVPISELTEAQCAAYQRWKPLRQG